MLGQKSFFSPIDNLVSKNHPYRKFIKLLSFKELVSPLSDLENTEVGRHGYGIESGFKMLLLQYMENISDRELERYLEENIAAKWFCGFDLESETPDFSYFSKLRRKIGTERLADLFNRVRASLKRQGLVREIFTFVDASKLISKLSLWEDRDRAIQSGEDKLTNETVEKVCVDHQARIGCKGKNKYWYDYKRHVSVDMQSGLINKVAVTPAKVTDAQGLKNICPNQRAVFGDKGYCIKPAQITLAKKGCHNATIKMNHMQGKDFRKDRWLSGCRAPYERVFSKASHKARYRGIVKNQFMGFMQALCHNLKRLVALEIETLELVLLIG